VCCQSVTLLAQKTRSSLGLLSYKITWLAGTRPSGVTFLHHSTHVTKFAAALCRLFESQSTSGSTVVSSLAMNSFHRILFFTLFSLRQELHHDLHVFVRGNTWVFPSPGSYASGNIHVHTYTYHNSSPVMRSPLTYSTSKDPWPPQTPLVSHFLYRTISSSLLSLSFPLSSLHSPLQVHLSFHCHSNQVLKQYMHHVIQKAQQPRALPRALQGGQTHRSTYLQARGPYESSRAGYDADRNSMSVSLFSSVQPSLLLVSTNLNGHLPHAYKICHESAMKVALEQLGYNDTYHMLSVMENRMDCGIWIEAFDAKYFGKGKPFGREEWDMLLGHCQVNPSPTHQSSAEPPETPSLPEHCPCPPPHIGKSMAQLTDTCGRMCV